MEDPKNYQAIYQTSLLDTQQLLDQVKQLGIMEDLVKLQTKQRTH